MGDKTEEKLTRLELADYLETLSKQLRSGTLEAEGRTWAVPEKVKAKLLFKEKKGRIVTKLSWHWPTLGDYDNASRKAVTDWQNSLKAVKKRLSACFGDLQRILRTGDLPDEKTLRDFIEASEAFAQFAEPEWQEAMREYMDHLKNFKLAVESRQLEVVHHELRDLRNRMGACHREFK